MSFQVNTFGQTNDLKSHYNSFTKLLPEHTVFKTLYFVYKTTSLNRMQPLLCLSYLCKYSYFFHIGFLRGLLFISFQKFA